MHLLWDLAPARAARTTQLLLVEFWIPTDWLPYLPDLSPLDFAVWHVLQAKVPAMPQADLDTLCLSIATEGDRLVMEYIRNTCLTNSQDHRGDGHPPEDRCGQGLQAI